MLSLISWIWGCSTDQEVLDDPGRIRDEIRRLDEMVKAYGDFGYDDMAAECSQRKALMEKALGRLHK